MKLSTAELSLRRETWNQIREVLAKHGFDTKVKLEASTDAEAVHNAWLEVYNIACCYAAMTGDDSLTPEPIRKEREQMIASLDRVFRSAKAAEKEKQRGQKDLF